MPVLAIFTGDITQAQYDALRKEVNWESRQPDGGIFHTAAFDDAGHIHAADVWQSQEALGAFVDQRLGPAMQKLQISPPAVEIYATHNINAYASIQEHRI